MKIMFKKQYVLIVEEREVTRLIADINARLEKRLVHPHGMDVGCCNWIEEGLGGKWFVRVRLYRDEWASLKVMFKTIEKRKRLLFITMGEGV